MAREICFVARNGVWLYEWFAFFGLPVEQSIRTMRYWDYIVAGMMMVVPAYRPLVSMIEKLCEENGWDIGDVSFTHSESYQNQALLFLVKNDRNMLSKPASQLLICPSNIDIFPKVDVSQNFPVGK